MLRRVSETNVFDFEIGYLVKSPCRDCVSRAELPECVEGCGILDQIQSVLADSIPSEKSLSTMETYDIPDEVLEQI